MARIRTVKPEFWTDPDMVGLPIATRLAFIGMWNHADDYGVLKDDPARLKLQILPADDVDFAAIVAELVVSGHLLRRQAEDGTNLLLIRTFMVHQKIDKRAVGRWGHPDDLNEGEPCPSSVPTTIRSTTPKPSPSTPTSAASSEPMTATTTTTSTTPSVTSSSLPSTTGNGSAPTVLPPNSAQSPPIPPNPPDTQPIPTDSTPVLEGKGLDGTGTENTCATSLEIVPVVTLVPSPAPQATRKRNLLFDALVEACGWDAHDLTARQNRSTGVAASELAKVNATPEDVRARAGEYQQRYPTMTCTPSALANQWASLTPKARPTGANGTPVLSKSEQAFTNVIAARRAARDT